MPRNILIDLNVILDVLLERRGFETSSQVLRLQELTTHDLYISGHIVTTFAYLLEHAKVPRSEIIRHVNWLLGTFSVVATTDVLLKAATNSKLTDYEDAVIEQSALECNASVIVTRNIKDFTHCAVMTVTPETFRLKWF